MSKKILSLLMLIAIVLPMLAACQNTGNETATPDTTGVVTEASDITTTPAQTENTINTPTPEEPLPTSSTLVGTKYIPPVDNQGNIGSCSAESVTYMQFTIAVAQYMNNIVGDKNWNPSTGNKNYIFSPKFTFVYSGAGTGYSYEILTDQGCLPLSKSSFKKNGTASILNDPMSRRWDVGTSGLMAQSLKYRLSNFTEIDFESLGYDFTTEGGKRHIEKIKRAIYEGNAVSVCGWSSYWEYLKVDNPGTLGKKNDSVIWAGLKSPNSKSDGNHAVCLVGYDDDITCVVGGVELKGAFCLANSWGQWCNNGFVWLMYDSLNRVSSYPELAENGFYSNRLAFYSTKDATEARIKTPFRTADNMQMIFTKTGSSATVEGVEYPVYTIKDRQYERYLGYSQGAIWKNEADDNSNFVLVPFSDYSKWSCYSFDSSGAFRDVVYKDSFLLVAVGKYNNSTSAAFITAGNSMTSSIGRIVDVSAVSKDALPRQAFMVCGYNADAETFTSSLKLFADYNGDADYERTGTLYRTSFVYWDKDVIVDSPNLILEVEVDSVKREALWVTLYRCDKEGNMVTKVPQVIQNSKVSTSDMDAAGGETRFDGKPSDGTYCKGYLAFGFNDFALLSKGYEYEELLWGVNVTGNLKGVKVKGLKLMTLDGTVLSQIKLNDSEEAMFNGSSRSFLMAMGDNISVYSGGSGSSGVLFNEALNKYVNNPKGTTLTIGDTQQNDASMKFVEQEDGTFKIYMKNKDGGNNWVLDISGKTAKEGADIKINKVSSTRVNQNWIVESTEKGRFKLIPASDKSLYLSVDQSTGGLCLTKKDSPECLWSTKSDQKLDFTIKAEKNGNDVKLSGVVPSNYTSGNIEIRITAQDGTYFGDFLTVTPENGAFEANVTLPEGTYLFSPYYEGQVYGFEYVYTNK